MLRRAVLALGSLGPLLPLLPRPAAAADAPVSAETLQALVGEVSDLLVSQGVEAVRPLLLGEGRFRDGEFYITVLDLAGAYVVFPPRPALAGHSVLNVRDADGRMLVQDMIRIANSSEGEGWTEYRWLNPVTNRIQPKVTFVKRVPGLNLLVFSGIYR